MARVIEMGAPTWPPNPPALGTPRRSRGAPRSPAQRRLAMRTWFTRAVALAVLLLAAAPTAAQQGVSETEIVLGCSNSFSGPLAFTGEQATKYGVDLWFKALND